MGNNVVQEVKFYPATETRYIPEWGKKEVIYPDMANRVTRELNAALLHAQRLLDATESTSYTTEEELEEFDEFLDDLLAEERAREAYGKWKSGRLQTVAWDDVKQQLKSKGLLDE